MGLALTGRTGQSSTTIHTWVRLDLDDREISPSVVRCVIDVLRALATVPASTSMRLLAVLVSPAFDPHQKSSE